MVTKQGSGSPSSKLKFDISALVDKARGIYGKSDAGLAKQISSGSNIVRPEKDTDFVLWTKGDHWQKLTGTKGIPFGKIIQIAGRPDSGKSTHAMCFMADAQSQGVLVILWDAEGKFSQRRYDSKMGGNSNELLVVQTNSIQDGVMHVANTIHAAKQLDPNVKVLIVWDSVGASLNSKEDSEETEEASNQPGVDARDIAKAVKKLNKTMFRYFNKETGEHSVGCLVVNQVYANIGSVGTKEKGGAQLEYLSSLILNLSRKSDLTKTRGGIKVKHGIVSRAKVKKNHLFDGDDCVSELELEVSASGIRLFGKGKKDDDGDLLEEEDD
jgi:RecA/RadA recombinase